MSTPSHRPDPSTWVPVSGSEPDWSRELPRRLWDPGPRLLRSIRGYQRCAGRRSPHAWLGRRWHRVWHRFWSVIAGADIPLTTHIGGGLLITHPNGIVVHPTARIGVNCLLFQQVTLMAGVELAGHVDIGAGAKIVRPVRIGEHARIGANAVVLTDVPARCAAVGIPARIVEPAGKVPGE
jgi:serine O-acetyltransferase